ncbi:cutinase-2 [Immersiella caudata]|uniref:Cutinase n=1 Tax=Immersiella caudata TaxID=314043 RepID=A0AA39X618_9PEZI|nr:cutinase-2 [Immersiella caudata]
MKSFTTFLFIALAASTPIVDVRQQRGRVGTTATEFTDGGCRDIIMLFARGSTEAGNMGTICGPPTANGLKEVFGANAVAVEGIDYGALLSTNFARGGADPAGIREMQRLIGQAVSQCPDSKLVVGGYSQGAALTHRAVENLPQAQKDAIVAAFTFGDTQNEQDNGQIPNFPAEKTMVICNRGDAVCSGTLTILPPHLDYRRRAPEAVDFLTQRLQAAGVQARKL